MDWTGDYTPITRLAHVLASKRGIAASFERSRGLAVHLCAQTYAWPALSRLEHGNLLTIKRKKQESNYGHQ